MTNLDFAEHRVVHKCLRPRSAPHLLLSPAMKALRWIALLVPACGSSGSNQLDTEPARIETAIAPSPVVAGATATATCIVYNAAGDVLDGQSPTLAIAPAHPSTTVQGLDAIVTRAGRYNVQCTLPGLEGSLARLIVVPALPARLTLGKSPDQRIYKVDSAIEITHVVTDRFENPIADASVTMASAPLLGVGPTTIRSENSFSYGSEGKYRISAAVAGPTEAMSPVTATVDITVNDSGPKIACGSPADGAMLNLAPGTPITFSGTAADVNGTMTVAVNGNPVAVASDGSFTAPVATRFGINFVDVLATDAFGVETAKVCTFLAAAQWADPSAGYGDLISLRLNQAAVDDGDRSGGINSLGDMLFAVANSNEISNALHNSLAAANPLKPLECDSKTCTFFGCICLMKSGVEYNSLRIDGPNSDALTLVSDGIAASAQVNGFHINLRVHGDVGPFPFTTRGDVDISDVGIGLTLDLSVAGQSPHISVRPGSASASVGSIATHFAGVDGWIINHVLVPLAQDRLRAVVRDRVQDFVTTNFNGVLDGVVRNLDVATLGASFDVPRLDTGSVELRLEVDVSSLSTTPSRALFGIGTKLTGPIANRFASLGVPLPAGPVLGDAAATAPAAVSAHISVLNQALHALWKADYFSAMVDGGTLQPGGAGIMLRVSTRLPPVASFTSANQVELSFGAIDVVFDQPSIPLHATLTVGARAHTDVALVGNALHFGGIVVDEVHVDSDALSLSEMRQMELEELLKKLAQEVADQSLNNALPALPIPTFAIPASLTAYGIPMGRFGIDNPMLAVAPPQFALTGGLAIH